MADCIIHGCGEPVDEGEPIEFALPGGGTASAHVCATHRKELTDVGDPKQTRPSSIVERPMPDDAIKDCSTAELLAEVLERAKKRRAAVMAPTEEASEPPWPLSPYLVARELSLAITAAEDCLTRHNKAVYMERGVFAITDAEVIPGADRPTFS